MSREPLVDVQKRKAESRCQSLRTVEPVRCCMTCDHFIWISFGMVRDNGRCCLATSSGLTRVSVWQVCDEWEGK